MADDSTLEKVISIKYLGFADAETALGGIEQKITALRTQHAELVKEQKIALAASRAGNAEATKQYAILSEKVIATKNEIRDFGKQNTIALKTFDAAKGAAGSIENLRIKIAALRAEGNSIDPNSVRFREISTEIKAADVQLNNLNHKLSGAKTFVGEYSQGFKTAFMELAGGLGIGFGIQQVIQFGKSSLEAYAKSEDASEKLLFALKGQSDVQARLLQQAHELENTTIYSHTTITEAQTFLALQGRTEEQIKKTIIAATDLSAVTGDDLESSVRKLDGTMNGIIGRMAKLDPRIKGLTKSQLENGDAIALLADKYKGLSEVVGDSLEGDMKRLGNRWTDLKENFAKGLMGAIDGVKTLFQAVTQFKSYNEVLREQADAQYKLKQAQDEVTIAATKQKPTLKSLEEALSAANDKVKTATIGEKDYKDALIARDKIQKQIDDAEGKKEKTAKVKKGGKSDKVQAKIDENNAYNDIIEQGILDSEKQNEKIDKEEKNKADALKKSQDEEIKTLTDSLKTIEQNGKDKADILKAQFDAQKLTKQQYDQQLGDSEIATLQKQKDAIDKILHPATADKSGSLLGAFIGTPEEQAKLEQQLKDISAKIIKTSADTSKSVKADNQAVEKSYLSMAQGALQAVATLASALKASADTQKAIAIATTIISTFQAAMFADLNARKEGLPDPLPEIAAGVAVAEGLARVVQITQTKYAEGGVISGPSHAGGGVNYFSPYGNVQLEGGEAVMSRGATAMFLPQLGEMNAAGGGLNFARGGSIPTPPYNFQRSSGDAGASAAKAIHDAVSMAMDRAVTKINDIKHVEPVQKLDRIYTGREYAYGRAGS